LDDAASKRREKNLEMGGGSIVAASSTGGDDDYDRLIVGLKRGDEQASEQFVRQYYRQAIVTARRLLRDDAAAADCVQDAFMLALRHIGDFEGRSSLGTWFGRITVNQALTQMRRIKSKNEISLDPLLPQFDDNECRIEPPLKFERTVEDIVSDNQLKEMIINRINELPDDYRVVLLLRDIEEMTTREVAETLGVSEAAVKTRLHRARAALKKLLEPLWLEYRT